MKNIIGILVVALLVSTTLNAQGRKGNNNKGNDFTPEQMATLQTKSMTLKLDLDKNQQEAVYNLQKNQMVVRQAMRTAMQERRANENTPTSDEQFQLKSSRLDRMQLHSDAMKKILTKEQFEKWEGFNKSNKRNGNKNMANARNNNKDCNQKGNKNNGEPRGAQRNRNKI